MFLPHFDVICDLLLYWRSQHGIYLFYIIMTQTTMCIDKVFYFKIFQHNAKTGLCPLWRRRKKPFDAIYYLYKMKQFHWLQCVAKNCDWSRKIAPLSTLKNLQRKQNWTAKSTNLEENAGKKSSQFLSSEQPMQWAERLGRCLENCRSLKKYPRKTCGCGQPRGHLIRVLNERSVNDGGDFCLLKLVILKSAWYSFGDTF